LPDEADRAARGGRLSLTAPAGGSQVPGWNFARIHDIIMESSTAPHRARRRILARDATAMYLDRLFKLMADKQASDIFISCGAPINIKINGIVSPISTQPLDVDTVRRIAYELMTKDQAREFETEMEMNLSHLDRAVGNFRINIFRQRGTIALVIRYVKSRIPSFDELRLPPVLLDMVMEKRGLVLIAGATGSGKSTTLAAMIDHRNTNRSGHILTIEDPIEYLFEHKQSIVNQREMHIDTQSYSKSLQNALREAPDLIMIGEIRDRETMQSALLHTLTGHLCLATLHANNSYHAMSRIINMFPYDARSGLLSDLSIGLKAIVCQRLIRNTSGEQQPAVEILLNTALIADLIKNGEIVQIKEAMEQSLYPGSQTFEQALCRMHLDGVLTYDEAMTASDSPTNLAWLINQNSPTARVDAIPHGGEGGAKRRLDTDFASVSIDAGMLNRGG
jgi:twitching motility protein PilU